MKWPESFIDQIVVGNCLEVMRQMPENCIDAIVTDPPYGIRFMGKSWDGADIEKTMQTKMRKSSTRPCGRKLDDGRARAAGTYDLSIKGNVAFQMWCQEWAEQCLRILKPGAHLLAFGGTRTYHRMACAIEDSGFDIRDQLQWLYGSGFPKSLDVSKAIDKAAGAERKIIELRKGPKPGDHGGGGKYGHGEDRSITAPATDAAKQWAGWGTALKPANEPICLARKPLSEPTVAANILKWGTGALNIDACRIGYEETPNPASNPLYRKRAGYKNKNASDDGSSSYSLKDGEGERTPNAAGRWPANVILDEEAGRMLDGQSGGLKSGRLGPGHTDHGKNTERYGAYGGRKIKQEFGNDSGGASRFFYCAKTSREERNIGMDGEEEKPMLWSSGTKNPGSFQAEGTNRASQNNHPTVKPVDLMKYLVILVTPPGGIVLDDFAGSGSTLLACAILNIRAIGIELNPEYAEIARLRIKNEQAQGKLF